MCGICGIFGLSDSRLLLQMMRVLEHRGPDDQGRFSDSEIGLGFRGVKVTGPTNAGQPVHNEEGSIHLVCDGRIYNWAELRTQLENKGHKFHTSSDVETIVHEYEEHGDFCVTKLRGMFAFALWDDNRKVLLLARDRLGTKPLYYSRIGKVFLFASEMKAILQYPRIERKIDYDSLHHFLTFNFNPRSATILQGINKLLAGHTLKVKKDGTITGSKYWGLKMHPEVNSSDYFIEQVRDSIHQCVQAQLMGEVPVGAYLSGGLDSSTLVGVLSELNEDPIETFSVGFPEEEHSELPYARLVARNFETNHHEITVEQKSARILPRVLWHFDEPIADPAAIPTYVMSELARKHCRVVFSGEGGDEQFAGYDHWKIMMMGERYLKAVPAILRKPLGTSVVRAIPRSVLDLFFKYSSSLGDEGLKRFSNYIASLDDPAKSYLAIVSIFESEEIEELCANCVPSDRTDSSISNNLNQFLGAARPPGLLSQLQLLEMQTSLPESHLMKNDKMSLAHGVEARYPFCDHVLAEVCARIPEDLKLKRLKDKYILRKAMEHLLPREVKSRKKTYFFVPIDSWIRGELGEIAIQILGDLALRCYFHERYINKIFDEFEKSPLYYGRQIWNLLTFGIWHKVYIERDNISSPPGSLNDLI